VPLAVPSAVSKLALAVCAGGFVTCAAGLSPAAAQTSNAAAADPPDLQQRLDLSRDAVRLYASRLRANLHEALKSGGPKSAIGACVALGPDLDAAVSVESGVEIGRTAVRVRNAENTPDAWEVSGLGKIAQMLSSGTDPKAIEVFEVTISSEGQRLFRYMHPIMMRDSCLVCHGPNVSADLKAEIARNYPDDKAIGFNVGELRGAFSLVQQLD
jgi:hypothetical protein